MIKGKKQKSNRSGSVAGFWRWSRSGSVPWSASWSQAGSGSWSRSLSRFKFRSKCGSNNK